MAADQIPEEDLDEEGVKPTVEPEDSKAREGFIQCVEIQPRAKETEDLTIHKEKDGDRGGGIPSSSAGTSRLVDNEERSQDVTTPMLESQIEGILEERQLMERAEQENPSQKDKHSYQPKQVPAKVMW